MKREHLWAHHEIDANSFWKLAEGGYATPMSVRPGERIDFHISNSRCSYDVLVFREGAGRELVKRIPDLRGEFQPVPEFGYRDGFGWPSTAGFTIPDNWRSGVYMAAFPTAQGLREILFVVRSKAPGAPMLLTIAANTYAAYNNVGGKCFYDYISTGRQHAKVVSFERPLPPDTMGNFHIWDQFFISWLESQGYRADYCVNRDIENETDLLSAYRANIRIGHDEYNSRKECLALQEFVKEGGNLLLFAGNAFSQEIELRNGGRQIFCAKPHYHDLPTPERPESSYLEYLDNLRQRTIGVSYTSYVNAKTPMPGVFRAPTTGEFGFYRVVDAAHWVFEGTNLREGDEFGREDSIVGVEADAADITFVNGQPRYTGKDGVSTNFKILAIADTATDGLLAQRGVQLREAKGEADGYGTMAINETELRGSIFNAATIEWSHGLCGKDTVASIITRNVLDRLAS